MAKHSQQRLASVHPPHSFEYANATARQAASLTVDDVGKLALQTDDWSLWSVRSVGPVTWVQVGAGNVVAPNINVELASIASATQPLNPQPGDFWLDTSGTPVTPPAPAGVTLDASFPVTGASTGGFGTAYTFNGVGETFTVPSATGRVLICAIISAAGNGAVPTPTAVTSQNLTWTRIVGAGGDSGNWDYGISFWRAVTADGVQHTNEAISVTWAGAQIRSTCAVWCFTGANTGAWVMGANGYTRSVGQVTSLSATGTAAAEGSFLIGAITDTSPAASASFTAGWTERQGVAAGFDETWGALTRATAVAANEVTASVGVTATTTNAQGAIAILEVRP